MSTKHSYELVYFDCKGLGEGIRYLLLASGHEFRDHRLKVISEKLDEKSGSRLRSLIHSQEWLDMKSDLAFGQIPLLIIDGKHKIVQAKAISRFLGNQFDMAGSDEIEKAVVDMVADRVDDLHAQAGVYKEPTDEQLKSSIEVFVKSLIPVLDHLEAFLKKNEGGDGFFVGKKMTWVDTMFAGNLSYIRQIAETYEFELPLAGYPKLMALASRVEAVPAIAAYISTRKTTFV